MLVRRHVGSRLAMNDGRSLMFVYRARMRGYVPPFADTRCLFGKGDGMTLDSKLLLSISIYHIAIFFGMT